MIEALFTCFEADIMSKQKILSEAKKRGDQRQQLANFRRAQSMMQRFVEHS